MGAKAGLRTASEGSLQEGPEHVPLRSSELVHSRTRVLDYEHNQS